MILAMSGDWTRLRARVLEYILAKWVSNCGAHKDRGIRRRQTDYEGAHKDRGIWRVHPKREREREIGTQRQRVCPSAGQGVSGLT